jgi:quinol monooxygenase YgiN
MIVEYIRYAVPADKVAQFQAAYAQAAGPLAESEHCLAYELARCSDDPTAYTLRIEWDTHEGHLKGFRSSPEFRRFYEAIAPFVANIQEMRHYDLTPIVGRKAVQKAALTRVASSAVIEATVDAVWTLLSDFNNVFRWHPDVRKSRIEDGGTGFRPGDVRSITLRDGTAIRERLLAISDESKSYTYSVIESPMPIRDHSSTVTLSATPEHRTTIVWTAEFVVDPAADAAAMAAGVKAGVIELGFAGLKAAIGKRA